MDPNSVFRVPCTLLPKAGVDLARWAVVACDQYTSEPDYWQAVARTVGEAPSTLHLTFPEVFLGAADAPARIANIQSTMRSYLAQGLLQQRDGAVYVERTVGGRTRPAAVTQGSKRKPEKEKVSAACSGMIFLPAIVS